MKPPLRQLKKDEIIWLGEHNCKAHRMDFLSHYGCYLKEKPSGSPFQEKVGYFDIETTGLRGDYHYVLSYAILPDGRGKALGRVLTTKEILGGVFDKELLNEMCDDIRKFHRLIGHYSGDYHFDLPFVRTRATKYGLDFPLYKEVYGVDTQVILKSKFCLSSNRLASACTHFGIKAKTHPLTPELWQSASIGNPKALAYIWTHNLEDVKSTKELYHIIAPYVLKGKKSI